MMGSRAAVCADNGAGDTVDRAKVAWPDGYFVSYGYDAASRMTSVVDSDGTALATRTSCAYDPLGRRTAKTVNGTATFFLHAPLQRWRCSLAGDTLK